jgi:hypothetical protein
MKTYKCRKDIAVRFALFGLVLLAAMAYLLFTGDIQAYFVNKYSTAFLIGGTLFSILYMLKGFNARLQVREKEIFFWDGLAELRHIDYQDIARIEYHPDLRIRFQMRDRKKTVFSIPNLFTQEDAEEFLDEISRRKWIKIEHVAGPGRAGSERKNGTEK